MRIKLDSASRSIQIIDPSNFRAFFVQLDGASGDAELLKQISVEVTSDHAWISEDWLRNWPALRGEAWWQEGLTRMMDAVERFGWIDRERKAIRAHFERG
jgi:hypothetical protein